jgi:hypothetical protein
VRSNPPIVRHRKHTMRNILVFLIAAMPLTTLAASIPDVICREGNVRDIDPKTLKVREYESSTTYRFANRNLYVKSSDREEYLYGAVSETEPGRYTVGHKIIYISSQESSPINLQLTHVYNDEVRVSLAKCAKR